MSVENGIYIIKNDFFRHGLTVADSTNQVEIHPTMKRSEPIKEKALWEIRHVDKDNYFLVNVHHKFALRSHQPNALGVENVSLPPGSDFHWQLELREGYFFIRPRENVGNMLGIADEPTINLDTKARVVIRGDFFSSTLWDIQFVKERYCAIRNKLFGQYLYAGSDLKVRLEDTGIPRKFLWDVTLLSDVYNLRNLRQVNKVLEIPNGVGEDVTVWDDLGEGHMRWAITKDTEDRFIFTNQAMNSVIQKNAKMEISRAFGTNRVPEARSYRVTRLISPETAPNALWRMQRLGPYPSFAMHNSLSFNGLYISVIQDLQLDPSRVKAEKWFPPSTGKNPPPRPSEAVDVIQTINISKERKDVPTSSVIEIAASEASETRRNTAQRQLEIVASIASLTQKLEELADETANKITQIDQATVEAVTAYKEDLPKMIKSDLVNLLGEHISQKIVQLIEPKLAVIRNDHAALRRDFEELKQRVKRLETRFPE